MTEKSLVSHVSLTMSPDVQLDIARSRGTLMLIPNKDPDIFMAIINNRFVNHVFHLQLATGELRTVLFNTDGVSKPWSQG